jgi:hypothetical protein
VANYTPSNDYGCQSVVSQAVNQYYSSLSSQEKEAKRLEVPIFRLWQYNIVAGEYQPAAYGIVCAYAAEGNAEDHGALFISSTSNGCFLAGKPHDAQISLSCDNDLTTGMNNLVTAASATDPDYDAYMPVILSIDAIGTVELTQHCKDFIEGSRAAYNALTDEQKAQITNYSTLTDAEAQWAALVAEAKPYADAVVALINAIPNPVVYNQECYNALEAAHNAYVALTEEQRDQVTNYNDYSEAEETYWNLKAANDVITLINAIGDVEYTPECKAKIDAARSAYNNLNLEKKGYVTNYNTLLAAEAAYAALIPVSSTVVWDEAVLATINVENGTENETFTKDDITLTALNGHAYYPDEDDHFLLDGMNDEPFSFSSTSADIVRIEITVSEMMDDTELIDGWQKTATGYRWIGEASSVDFGITLPKVTQIAFYLGNGSTPAPTPSDEQVPTNEDPENPSYHYSTFFHSTQNYKLTNDGTQAFIADLSNNDLVLTEIANGTQVIPANTAVILRKTGSADPVVLTPTEENGVSVNPDDNSLEGVDAITAVTSIDGLTTTNCYVLSGTNEYGVGFYRINSDNLKAHKAYVKYAGLQTNAPRRMRFVFNQEQVATGVENVQGDKVQSTKVLRDGQLVIIRNGVEYNAAGQMIK